MHIRCAYSPPSLPAWKDERNRPVSQVQMSERSAVPSHAHMARAQASATALLSAAGAKGVLRALDRCLDQVCSPRTAHIEWSCSRAGRDVRGGCGIFTVEGREELSELFVRRCYVSLVGGVDLVCACARCKRSAPCSQALACESVMLAVCVRVHRLQHVPHKRRSAILPARPPPALPSGALPLKRPIRLPD